MVLFLFKDRSLLAENGRHIELGPGWAKSLLARMGYHSMVKGNVATTS